MKISLVSILFYTVLSACGSHKNLVQTNVMLVNNDTLVQHINNSKHDKEAINAQLKKIAQENDLVIAFASLNYAWVRKGTYCVLASRNNEWKLYSYQAKLPPSASDIEELAPLQLTQSSAENIKKLYAASDLWTTSGDADGSFCTGKTNCNINDAESWAIIAATPQNVHTTTYYAPKFFEECCPGNPYRARFVAIAEEMMTLAGVQNSALDK